MFRMYLFQFNKVLELVRMISADSGQHWIGVELPLEVATHYQSQSPRYQSGNHRNQGAKLTEFVNKITVNSLLEVTLL